VDNVGTAGRIPHSAVMPPLVTRLVRRHRLAPGRLLLGLVDDGGYVRDTSSTSVGPLFDTGSPAQVALALRSLTATLDLRRRDVMALCAVMCRDGPVVWLPADLRCRAGVHDEARAQSLRPGVVFIVGEGGWRDDGGDAGATPAIAPPELSPWDSSG
jgi:hypothetical protein